MSYQDFLKAQRAAIKTAPVPLDAPIPLSEVHTPALLLDLDIMESNLQMMQRFLSQHDIGLRPHTKMHKCPEVARRQIENGAVGVCAATISEAEVMSQGGVKNILVTSPVATSEKYARVISLAVEMESGLQIVVDNEAAANELNRLAAESGLILDVLIDLDPGMGRTGVATGDPALKLAGHITEHCDYLALDGLQMYAGNCMHIHGFEARREKYLATMTPGRETRDLLLEHGIETSVFTGGGTGSFDIEPELGLLTDVQAGSYAFMDVEYLEIGGPSNEARFDSFPPSLFVLVSTISQPQKRLITVDAGYKAFASDTVKPEFADLEGVKFHWGGDEHGIVQLNNPSRVVGLGEKLAMVTSHCDPTVNLYDYYHVVQNEQVIALWPVSARGRSQ